MKQRLFISEPHGAQEVILLDDDPKPGNRIFQIRELGTGKRRAIGMTGEELDSLCRWWEEYKTNANQPERHP